MVFVHFLSHYLLVKWLTVVTLGMEGIYTVKKVSDISVPSRDVTYQTLPGWE